MSELGERDAPQAVPLPLGRPRQIATCILLAIVTLGIYTFVWTYQNYREMQEYSGRGIGGVLGVIVHFFASPATFFIIPYEIKTNLYEQEAEQSPVDTIIGLWFLLPIIGSIIWYVKVQNALNEFWMDRGA